MTEPWSIMAWFLLIDGICSSYPNIDPNTISKFLEKSQDKLGFYEIDDKDLEIITFIAAEMLENPSFNLIDWYRNELDKEDLYNNSYTKLALQKMEQLDSEQFSDAELFEFSDAESVLSVLLDMFDLELDQDTDFNELPELQPVLDTDFDLESQATLEGGSYSVPEPSIANLEPNSTGLDTESNLLEPTIVFNLEPKSNSSSSLGNLTSYELRKVGDILAWKVHEVLTHCQPFPDDETEALSLEFFDGKPRFEVTWGGRIS